MTERSAQGVPLETERPVLRQFTMSDAGNLAGLDADPDVMRFITGGLATSRAEIKDSPAAGVHGLVPPSGRIRLLGGGPQTHRGVPGMVPLPPSPGRTSGEIALGFRLRKPAWGKGYATEGSRALMHKGFTEFGARRVVAETMAVNPASRRVLEKAGLNFIRIFHQPWPYRVDGREFGDVEYAVTKNEWERQNGLAAG